MPASRRLFALLLVSCMVHAAPGGAASALAIVAFASNAQLADAALSVGTTVFTGDRLSTDVNGELALRSKTFRAQLGSRSEVVLMDCPAELGGGTAIEMFAGRMDLSTIEVASVAIRADGAVLRPAQNMVALATVEVHGPREVHIYVRRGAYDLEYHEEHAVLEEGKSYAILLDPTAKEIALAEKLDPVAKSGKSSTLKRTFLLVLIAAAAVGATIPEHRHHMESPHNPGHGRH